jgi:hypothetical protein
MKIRLALATLVAAFVAVGAVAGTASAANISWEPAPAYSSTNMAPGHCQFLGIIGSYQGINVYCWTTGSSYSSAMGTTSKWFYVRWWAVYHWLYGFTPANYVNNQPVVGHC